MRKCVIAVLLILAFLNTQCSKQQDEITADTHSLFPIITWSKDKVTSKARFIDKTGKVVIDLKYEKTNRFSEGLAGIRMKGLWGFIDEMGTIVIAPQYDKIGDFREGLASVSLNKKWGFIDKTGKLAISIKYDTVREFTEGVATVELTGQWQYIDKAGQVAITLGFNCVQAWFFSEGLAAVNIGGRMETSMVYAQWGKWGFINKEGVLVIPPQFDWAGEFSEGLAAIMVDKKYGFINKSGEVIIVPQYAYAGIFKEGVCPVQIGDERTGKYGVINKRGKMVIDAEFLDVLEFSDGFFGASLEYEKYGFINKTGTTVIEARFSYVSPFRNGLSKVWVSKYGKRRMAYIDKTGKYVWREPAFAAGRPE